MTIDRTSASALAEAGLAAVVGPELVVRLREDSPLNAVGLTPADLVCVSDAVAEAATSRGIDCVLLDADVADVATVADLVAAVQMRGEAS